MFVKTAIDTLYFYNHYIESRLTFLPSVGICIFQSIFSFGALYVELAGETAGGDNAGFVRNEGV